MVLSSVGKKLLASFLSEYVEGDYSVAVSLFGKHSVSLKHVELKHEILTSMICVGSFPLRFSACFISELNVDIPFISLRSKPVRIDVSDLVCVLEMESVQEWNPSDLESVSAAAMKAAVEALWLQFLSGSAMIKQQSAASYYFNGGTITRILDNVEVTIRRLHVCIQGPPLPHPSPSISPSISPSLSQSKEEEEGMVSRLHCRVEEAFMVTTDDQGERHFDGDCDNIVFKHVQVNGIQLGFLPATPSVLSDAFPSLKEKQFQRFVESLAQGNAQTVLGSVDIDMRLRLNTAYALGPDDPARVHGTFSCSAVQLAVDQCFLGFATYVLSQMSRFSRWVDSVEHRRMRRLRRDLGWPDGEGLLLDEFRRLCQNRLDVHNKGKKEEEGSRARREHIEAGLTLTETEQSLRSIVLHQPTSLQLKVAPVVVSTGIQSKDGSMSTMERAGNRALFRASEDVSLERVVAQLAIHSEELDRDEFEVQFHEEADAIGLIIDPDLTVRACVHGSAADLSELVEPGLRISAIQGLATRGLQDGEVELLMKHSIRPVSIRFKGSMKAAANANKFIAGRTVQVIDVEVSAPSITLDLRAQASSSSADTGSNCSWRLDVRGILFAAAVTAEASKLTITERLNALSSLAIRLVVCGMHASFDQARREMELLSSYADHGAEMPSIRVNYPRTYTSFNAWAAAAFRGAPLTHRLAAGALPLVEMDMKVDEASQAKPKLKVAGHAGTLVVNADVRALPGLLEISRFVNDWNTDAAASILALSAASNSRQAAKAMELQQWELDLDFTVHPLCLRVDTGEQDSLTLELTVGRAYLRNKDKSGVSCMATVDAIECSILDKPVQALRSRVSSEGDEGFQDARSSSEDDRTVLVQVPSPVFELQIRPSLASLGLTLNSLSIQVTKEKLTTMDNVGTRLQQAAEEMFPSTPAAGDTQVENQSTPVTILSPDAFATQVHQAVEDVLGVAVDGSEVLTVYEVDPSSWVTILEQVFSLDPFPTPLAPDLPELSCNTLSCSALAQQCYEMIYGLPFTPQALDTDVDTGPEQSPKFSRSASLRAREEVSSVSKKLGEIEALLHPLPAQERGLLIAVDVRVLNAEVEVVDALVLEIVNASARGETDALSSTASLTVGSFRLVTKHTREPVICKLDHRPTTPRSSPQPMLHVRVDYGKTLPSPTGLMKTVSVELASKEEDILEGYTRQNPRKRPSRRLDKARRHFHQHLKLGGALAELDATDVHAPPLSQGTTSIKLGLVSSMLSLGETNATASPVQKDDSLDEAEVWLALRSIRLVATFSGSLALLKTLRALSDDDEEEAEDKGREVVETASLAVTPAIPSVLAEARVGLKLESVEITCELEKGSRQEVVLNLGLDVAYIGHQLTEQVAVSVSDLCVSTREPGVTTRSLVKPWSGELDYGLARSDPLDWTNLVRRTSMKLDNIAVELWTSDIELLSTMSDTLSQMAALFADPTAASTEPQPNRSAEEDEDPNEPPSGLSVWSLATGNGVYLADTTASARMFLVFDWFLPSTGLSLSLTKSVQVLDGSESRAERHPVDDWIETATSRVAETSIHSGSLTRSTPEAHDRIEVLMKNIELRVVKGILVAYTSGTFLPVVKLRCYDALVRADSSSLFVQDALLVVRMSMEALFYNLRLETWEPLIEPTNDIVLSVYKGPLAKAVNIDITSLQRINFNLSEDALSLYLAMSTEFAGSSSHRTHSSGQLLNKHSRLSADAHEHQRAPDYVLINQTGESLELVDLFQIGCNRRGSFTVRSVDGWSLPSRTRWGRTPELEFRLEPWGVSYHGNGEEDCMIDYPGVIQNGFPSLELLLKPVDVGDKESTSARVLHGAIDLVPFILMPGQHRKEWFSLCEEEATSFATAEILLSICFHAAREDIPMGTTAVERMEVQSEQSMGVSFDSVSNERWFEETKPKQIIQHLASTGITTVRKAEVVFPLWPSPITTSATVTEEKTDTERQKQRRNSVLSRVFIPLDTTGRFVIAGVKGFMLPITVGFRDDQRKTIVLQSPLVVKNNTKVDIELRICPPLQKSTEGEQRRHEDYSSLRQIGNRSAVLKASGNHLASVDMGLRELFDRDLVSKWVDGGHSLQTITGTNSWVQWEYETPHQVCLYRITPSMVQVRQSQHARPFRNAQMELVDAGPNDLDSSVLGVDPKGWTLMAKSHPRDVTWEVVDERSAVDFTDAHGARKPKEFWVRKIREFKVFRLEFHQTDNVPLQEVEAWNAASVHAKMNLSTAAIGPQGTYPIALSSIELFEESISSTLSPPERTGPEPGESVDASQGRIFARMPTEEQAEQETSLLRAQDTLDAMSVSSATSADSANTYTDSESSSRMMRGTSTRSSAETWRCMLCDEQNVRQHRRCILCSSVNPDAEANPTDGKSFSKTSRRVRERAKRFTGSATATTRAVSSQLSSVGRKRLRRLPPEARWVLSSEAVVHSEGKRQQKRCFLVLTRSALFIQRKGKAVVKERGTKESNKARTIMLDTIKRIREVEGLDTPGIELFVETSRSIRLTGSLRIGKRASSRQSKTVLFFNEAGVRHTWAVAFRKALASRSRVQEASAPTVEDIRVVVRAGERYNVPLRFLGDGTAMALPGQESGRESPRWALYVRKHTPKEEDFSWSPVITDLGAHNASSLSPRLIESIACASMDLPIIHFDAREEDMPESPSNAETRPFSEESIGSRGCTLFSLSARISARPLPRYNLKGERVSTEKFGDSFRLSMEPLVVLVNALPYRIRVHFFLGNSKIPVGFKSLEPGEKRSICEIDERCLLRFRIWPEGSVEASSDWSEKIAVRAAAVQQETQVNELDSEVSLWPAGCLNKTDSNRMCVLSLERFRDPCGPLKLTIFAPCWVYNFSDVPLLLKPTKSVLSKLEIFNTYLPPNFSGDGDTTKAAVLKPALESLSLGRSVVVAGVLHSKEVKAAEEEAEAEAEADRTGTVRFGMTEEVNEEHQTWTRNWQAEETDRVSGWSAPFKVTPGGETVHKELVFRKGAHVVKRSIGIEMVSPNNAPFNRSIQVIIRTSFILVNRLPRRILAFRQERLRRKILSAFRYDMDDLADNGDDVVLRPAQAHRVPFHFNGLLKHHKFQIRGRTAEGEWCTGWSGSMSVLKETSTTLLLRSLCKSPNEMEGATRVRVLIREEGGATFVLFLPDVSDVNLRTAGLPPQDTDPPFYSIRNASSHCIEIRQTGVDTSLFGNILLPAGTFRPYGFDEPSKGTLVDIRALRPLTEQEIRNLGKREEVVYESGKEGAILLSHRGVATALGIQESREAVSSPSSGPVGEPLLFTAVSNWHTYSLQALQEMTPLVLTDEEGATTDTIEVEGVINRSMRTLELRSRIASTAYPYNASNHLHSLRVKLSIAGLTSAARYTNVYAEVICSGKRKEVAVCVVNEGADPPSEPARSRIPLSMVDRVVERVKAPSRENLECSLEVEFRVDSPPKELQVNVFGVLKGQKRSLGSLPIPLMYILWENNYGWIAFGSKKWKHLVHEESKEKQKWKRSVNSLLLNGFRSTPPALPDEQSPTSEEDSASSEHEDGFVPLDVTNVPQRRAAPLMKAELLCSSAAEIVRPSEPSGDSDAYKISFFVSSFGISIVHSEREKDLVYVLFQRLRVKLIKLPVVLDLSCSLGRLQIDNQAATPRYPVLFSPELRQEDQFGNKYKMLKMRLRTLSDNPTIQHIEICRVNLAPSRMSLDEAALAQLAGMNSSGLLNSLVTSVDSEDNIVLHPRVLAATYTEQSTESQMVYVDELEISDLGVFVELEFEGGRVIARNGDILSNALKRYVPNVVLRGLPLFLEGIHWKQVFLPYEDLRHKLLRHITIQVAKNVLYKVLADASTTSLVNPFQQAKLVLFGAYELVNQPVQGLRDENLSGCCDGLQKGFINFFARVGNSMLELVHSASSGVVVIMNEWASVNRFDYINRSIVLTLIVVREVSGAVRDSANEISVEVIGGRPDIARTRTARAYSEKGVLTVYGPGTHPHDEETTRERQAALKIIAWYTRIKSGSREGKMFNQLVSKLIGETADNSSTWCDRRLQWCAGSCGSVWSNLKQLSSSELSSKKK